MQLYGYLTRNSMATKEDSRWERRTWPELKRLAEEVPEAGIHFQSTVGGKAFTTYMLRGTNSAGRNTPLATGERL